MRRALEERSELALRLGDELALACCSWATNEALDDQTRLAVTGAAIALAAATSQNLREVMGLNENLLEVGKASPSRALTRLARLAAAGALTDDPFFQRSLEPLLRDLDAARDERAGREASAESA